ncbi:hypothetical protein ACGC1H_000228 [Rhizoctonia solani]
MVVANQHASNINTLNRGATKTNYFMWFTYRIKLREHSTKMDIEYQRRLKRQIWDGTVMRTELICAITAQPKGYASATAKSEDIIYGAVNYRSTLPGHSIETPSTVVNILTTWRS